MPSDAAGRRIGCDKSGSAFASADTFAYRYNSRSELTNATAAADAAYRYGYAFDDIGNREAAFERGTNTAYTANALNQYTAVDAFVPQYDADGNETLAKTATGVWSVTYNAENRPITWIRLESNNQTIANQTMVSMSYDRMGRRVTKNDQRFVYNGYLQVTENQTIANQTIKQFFIWDPTEKIATRPLVWRRGESAAYYTHDGNKNVSEIVSASGAIAAHYEYAPFGTLTAQRGTSAAANPWRFSSEYAEDETGTVYYNYRHYEPGVGRWMSRDRITLGSLKGHMTDKCISREFMAFSFVGNCSIMAFDELGEVDIRLGPIDIPDGDNFYGNYCGAKKVNGNVIPTGQEGMTSDQIGPPNGPDPIDPFDTCCMQHDKCLADVDSKYPRASEYRSFAIKNCDARISACWICAQAKPVLCIKGRILSAVGAAVMAPVAHGPFPMHGSGGSVGIGIIGFSF